MLESTLFILLLALVLDWYFGEPEILWDNLPHPVVIFGKAVSFMDKRLNRRGDSDARKHRKGTIAISVLLGLALLAGLALNWLVDWLGWIGVALEIVIVFTLLAQKSLYEHVREVWEELDEGDLEDAREEVAKIVGRDPKTLDPSGIARASIESLAENFSDGVIAPAIWYLVFGLPGLMVYKMINTADSMIAYRNERYLWFGRVAAQIDDLANWLPARLSALLIAAGSGMKHGTQALKQSMIVALRDSGLHRSPNAGWPEAAMAGGIDIALGGPRIYDGETVSQAWLNASGERDLDAKSIYRALDVFILACFAFWVIVAVLWLLSLVL